MAGSGARIVLYEALTRVVTGSRTALALSVQGNRRDSLGALRAVRTVRRDLHEAVAAAVAQARTDGASWSEVADTLGETEPFVRATYEGLVSDLRDNPPRRGLRLAVADRGAVEWVTP